MKQILIFLLCLKYSVALSCECQLFTKFDIKKLKSNVDYIVYGTVINQINIENSSTLDHNWKNNKWATEVVLQVDRVIKGKLESNLIYITQYNQGNCAVGFTKGEQYVIAGNRVDEFVDLTPNSENNLESHQYPFTRFINNRFLVENSSLDFLRWNELCREKVMILTNDCSSGSAKSYFGKLILESR